VEVVADAAGDDELAAALSEEAEAGASVVDRPAREAASAPRCFLAAEAAAARCAAPGAAARTAWPGGSTLAASVRAAAGATVVATAATPAEVPSRRALLSSTLITRDEGMPKELLLPGTADRVS
jgi:hypothetical protein